MTRMTEQNQPARRFAQWTESLPNDVWTVWSLMTNDKVARQGRRMLAGALNYLLTQLDLIPDHERAGAVDDAMVLRLACALATEHAADLTTADSSKLARLANDEDVLKAAFDDKTFARLRRHVIELADKPVRNRTAEQLLSDEHAQAEVKRELEQALRRVKPLHLADEADADAVMVSVKSYLQMKLK